MGLRVQQQGFRYLLNW